MPGLREQFANPPNSFRLQPFWFLNHRLEEDQLRLQIREMADKGIGGAVLHARHGLLTEYMSAQWLEAIGVCIDEMRRLGMEAWLYDENNWPSGTHGGQVTREHPEYRMRYLRVQSVVVNGGVTYQVHMPDYGGKLICIHAIRVRPESVDGMGPLQFAGDPRDVTTRYDGDRFRWQAPPGHWFVAAFFEQPVNDRVTFFEASYIDTMDAEAVAVFKTLAYEPYTRFSEEFGNTVKGVFTDEPGLMIHDGYLSVEPMASTVEDPKRRLPGVTLAWTRDMPARFEQMHGYDLGRNLMHLLWEIGEETPRIRADYAHALSEWYVESYHGQLGDWCREHSLDFIGHTLEDPLWRQVRSQGDQMALLAKMDRPGFDYLGHGATASRILSAKCAASSAHIEGRSRVCAEAFGGSGHQSRLAEQKLNLNFMCALGCNMLIPHAFYYSFAGLRKSDWPPTEFYHNGYWPWYRQFADYAARVCLLQATGHHVSDALVLLPVETMYVDSWRSGELRTNLECEQVLDMLTDELLRLHHDYDVCNDAQLSRAQTGGGRLSFPTSREDYPLVIVPGSRVMSVEAARTLRDLFESGGKLLFLGELPRMATDRGDDEALRSMLSEVFGIAPGADIFGPEKEVDMEVESEAGGVARWYSDLPITGAWLQQAMRGLISPDVAITAETDSDHRDIVCTHRREANLELYFLCNRGEQRQAGTVHVGGAGALEEFDLETGECTPAPVQTTEHSVSWFTELEPGEARAFALDREARPEMVPSEGVGAPEVVTTIDLGSTWRFETRGGNVAILDRWQFIAHDRTAGGKLQLQDTPGRVNTYFTTFEVEGQLGPVKLVLDDIRQYLPSHVGFLSGRRNIEIYVNGSEAPPIEPAQWQDPCFMATEIGDLLQPGSNELQVCVVSLVEPFEALSWPAYLVGDFTSVGSKLGPPAREMDGLFSERGYAHFPGIGVHSTRVRIPGELLGGSKRLILDFGQACDCARVVVNGKEAAVRLWEPFEVEITEYLRSGDNQIAVEVAGTLANLYGKETRPAGIKGPARIWVVG